jgi:phthalate 4,5-dioxygenase reductase subunit
MSNVESAGALNLRLVVADRREVATGIHCFELRDPAGAALPPFTAGAHIGVEVPGGALRKYSLCNASSERDRYVIAVLREAGGRGGSVGLCDGAPVGAVLQCSGPHNDFALVAGAREHLFIAGGIGITPILAMMRELQAVGHERFHLHYCTRSPEATAFRDELSAPPFASHITIHHDGGDPSRQLDLWPLLEKPTGAHLYCCGPRPMLEAVRDMTGHWSAATVHFESFVDAEQTHVAGEKAFRVRLARSGAVIEVAADQSILDALREAGHDVESSCESGTCGTCRTGLISGVAEHRDFVLMDDEQAGNIMICVSRARSDELVLDR